MRIKVLKVDIDINIDHENAKQLLLQAVKNNFSLRSVDGKRLGMLTVLKGISLMTMISRDWHSMPIETIFWTNGSTILRRSTEKCGPKH